jgi:hypothetical protein
MSSRNGYKRLDVDRLTNVPQELRDGKRFVCWREEIRDGKRTKVPVDPHTGKNAKPDDPETWNTLAAAVAYYRAHKSTLYGVGRMFAATDEMIGIDLDECLDEHGNFIPDSPAAKWLPRLDSYAEVSPSRVGIKVWTHAKHALGGKNGRRNAKEGVAGSVVSSWSTIGTILGGATSAKVLHPAIKRVAVDVIDLAFRFTQKLAVE